MESPERRGRASRKDSVQEGESPARGDVIALLANRANQAILNLLAVEPTYPRKIGELLLLPETEVARRLRQMEAAGLVTGQWRYIGKNVKLYSLVAQTVTLQFTPEGLRVDVVASPDSQAASTTRVVNPFRPSVPASTDFVGRARELQALAQAPAVAIVQGMPGVGKTSLLARFVQGHAEPRPVFWHSFRGVESLNWITNRIAVFLAQHGARDLLTAVESEADIADKRELMLRSLDDARFVFALDDTHRIEDDDVRAFVTDAIERTRSGKLLIGTRERPRYNPALHHVELLHLEGLSPGDVATFLDDKGVNVKTSLLPKLQEEVGGHPLALNLFLETAREQGVPIETLLDRIPEKNLEDYLLQEVFERLGEEERDALVRASVFRTRFTLDDLAALSRKSPEAALLRLRRRLLVQAFENGEYALHEIVRNFFYNLLKAKREVHDRAAQHYLAQGTIEGRLEAMHHLLTAGRRDRVLELLEANLDLREFDFIDAGYQNLYLSVLELFQRDEVLDPRRWALIEDEKGDIRFQRGDWETALSLYDAAAAYFMNSKDVTRSADLAWKRALCLQRLGRTREALAACKTGLTVAPASSLPRERLEELSGMLAKDNA